MTITEGDTPTRSNNHWRVPTRDLIASGQVLIEQGTLRIGRRHQAARKLLSELQAHRVQLSTDGHTS